MLGVAALRLWQRRRGAPAGWLAATFGVLAFVVIVGRVLPQPQHSAILRWFQKIDVIVLLLFPYFLFRFAAAFEEMSVVVRRVAAGLTAAVAVWTLLLPRIPAPDEPRPGWYQAYIVGLLVAWTILSVVAAARLWRAGRGQPAMAGRRMRLLSVGSILMNVALLIAGAAPSTTNYGVQLVTQVLALASAVVFYMGFSPPTLLRMVWRRPEVEQLRHAEIGLMAVTTREGIAAVLLPYVARMLGGRAAALADPRGQLLASHGFAAGEADRLVADVTSLDTIPPAGVEIRPDVLALALGSSRLAVEMTPYAPFFGDEEFGLIQGLGGFADLALERASLFQRERAAQQALAEANAELEGLLYSVSHDLKSPLISLLGYLEYLKQDHGAALPLEAVHYVDRMTASAAYMQQLIQDLLAYARVGGTVPEWTAVDCEAVLARTLLDLQLLIEEQRAEVSHDPLPPVRGEAKQVGLVFQNLLGNALKFHGAAPPRIHVSARREGAMCVFAVQDNGIGVEAKQAERIFQVFQRLHTRSEYPGTGIGLAICKKIVERHGGRIWVASAPGQGSTFFFTLPA